MKLSRIYYVVMLILLAGVTSCNEDDDIYPQLGDDPRNLTQIVNDDANLSTLAQALTQVGLDSTLRSTSTYTLFAPNNAAFGDFDMSSMSEEELTNFLLNHVLSTTTADFSSTLTTGYTPTMATGPDDNNLSLFINTDGGLKLNGMATPVQGSFDVGSTNGVLHVVDNLLTPPTVLDHTKANPNFSKLAEAIELAGLSETLSMTDPELETYPFTVFAPTNAAFESFMMQLNGAFGWTSLGEIPTEILQEVLMYHVVTGSNTLAPMISGTEQVTMQGNSFMIDDNSVIQDGSYDMANFTLTDIQGVNGVVHGVNKVLIPETVFQDILGATLDLKERSEDRGFTSFLAAIEKAGLTEQLETEEFTVFVPNNDAFNALFSLITNFDSLDDFDTPEEIEALKQLLTYHLYDGQLMSSQLTDGGSITTVYGDNITADLSGDNARLRSSFEEAVPAQFVNANIGATNGILHEINRVLIPAELVSVLGIESSESGQCPVKDENLVFFDWNGKDPYWGNVTAENDPSLSLDGENYGRANFQTGGTGWVDLFWRNDAATFNGASVVGNNIDGYSLKFDINVIEPITAGMFRIRFNDADGEDVFYNWQPWNDLGESFTTDGWETVEIPLSEIGVSDFSQIDAEFGMAFEGADILLNFAIDNVRFDTPGCGGPEPVANSEAVFFDWDGKDPYWGNVTVENDASISLDGSNYGRANFQTGGTGWQDLFWRNDATFYGANMVGSNLDEYVLKFDINIFEPINSGMFRIRFNDSDGVDAFYDWQPWNETGNALDTDGDWITVSIPATALGVPDFSLVDAEFGMAFEGADILLNFAIDNVRFEEL
ncbi:glycan-binding surface protein [uncultured Christiangramia sp.]|uniref:glycan-binding surface protein n=1 Tax=uncultured Christiangramia sp. TaxID=503836 RepID=UPI00262BD1CA|nr:glycan-binding surface protein [uncultured Christiangramia sp.]